MKNKFESRSKLALFLNGNPISEYIYDTITEVGKYILAFSEDSFSIYNRKGKIIFSEQGCIQQFNNEAIVVKYSDNSCCVYSYDGKTIIPVGKFTDISVLNDVICVMLDDKCGFYSYQGDEIIQAEFDEIERSYTGNIVSLNDKQGFYSHDGKCIIPVQYHDIAIEYDGYIKVAVKTDSESEMLKYGLFSSKGKLILPPEFDFISFNSDGIEVEINNKAGVYSYEGKEIVPVDNWHIFGYYDYGIEVAKKNSNKHELIGVYSYEGKMLAPCIFNYIASCDTVHNCIVGEIYHKGFGAYMFGKGFIIPPEFSEDDDIDFQNNGIQVWKNCKTGLFSYEGKLIVPIRYRSLKYGITGIIVSNENKRFGVYSYDGELIVPVKYKNISISKSGIIEVQLSKDSDWQVYEN